MPRGGKRCHFCHPTRQQEKTPRFPGTPIRIIKLLAMNTLGQILPIKSNLRLITIYLSITYDYFSLAFSFGIRKLVPVQTQDELGWDGIRKPVR